MLRECSPFLLDYVAAAYSLWGPVEGSTVCDAQVDRCWGQLWAAATELQMVGPAG